MPNNIYTRMGNVEFKGLTNINGQILDITQLYNSLFNPVGWIENNTYTANQFVSYQGKLYYSKEDNNKGHLPTDTNYWNVYSSGSGGGEGGNANLNALIFKIPYIGDNSTLHLYIDFSSTSDFASVTTISSDSTSNVSLFKVFSGQEITDFPTAGVSSIFNGEVVTLDITSIDKSLNYFRFYWYNGSDFGGKSFGRLDGALQVFESSGSGSGGSSEINVNSRQFTGNGTASFPLTLRTTIEGVQEFLSNDDFTINANESGKNLILKALDISLNGSFLNTAGGLLKLGDDGLIPTELYNSSGGDPKRLLPALSDVPTLSYGNPLVLKQDLSLLPPIGNDSNVILLIQGTDTTNKALGVSSELTYQNLNLTYSNEYFTGGTTISWTTTDIIGKAFQFDIEILRSDLTDTLVSLFEHEAGDGNHYAIRINNSSICYGIFNEENPTFYNIPQETNIRVTLSYDKNSGLYYFYLNGNKILETTAGVDPFKISSASEINFVQKVSSYSALRGLTGFSGKWRNLRFCLVTKNYSSNDFDPKLGEEYTMDAPSGLDALTVNYNWEELVEVPSGSLLFGKVNGQPTILPYPNIEGYTLKPATSTTLGGIIVGNGLMIDTNGVLSIPSTGGVTVDLSNHIGSGNISIRSVRNVTSTLTLQSGNLESSEFGGKLFLGNNDDSSSYLLWGKGDGQGIYIEPSRTSLRNYGVDNVLASNRSRVDVLKDGGVEIYSYTNSLKYNGAEKNTANGLVVIGADGKIPTTLYESGSGGSGKVTITDGNTTLTDISTIRTGDNLTIAQGDVGEAVIQSYQTGSFIPDIEFTSADLVNNKLTVTGTTLGNIAIEDNEGYMHIPAMRQIENNVEVNFNGITVDGTWKVRFSRGIKGETGEMTEEDTIALIIALA